MFNKMGIKNCHQSTYRDDENDDDVEPRDITVQRIPFGAMPQQFPLTHMPQQQIPAQHMMPPQQQQIPPQIPFVVSNIVSTNKPFEISILRSTNKFELQLR